MVQALSAVLEMTSCPGVNVPGGESEYFRFLWLLGKLKFENSVKQVVLEHFQKIDVACGTRDN